MTDTVGSGRLEGPSLPLSPVPDEAGENAGDLFDAAPQGVLVQLSDELTTLRRHIETVEHDVAGLAARVGAAEATLGDRLSEYAETVVQLGRGLTTNVSTYREGNERTVAELRRALADSEELLRVVLTKVDDLAVDLAAVRGDLASPASDDALDVDELRAAVRDAVEPLDVRALLDQLSSDIAALGERVTSELAAVSAAPAPASIDTAMHAELLSSLEGMRVELERLGRNQAEASNKSAADVERGLVTELEAMREEIAGLKRRIALRAKSTGIDDEQLASLVQQISSAISTRLPDEEVERLAAALAHRMTQAFEVVPDDDPAPAPKPPPKRASKPPTKTAARSPKSSRRR